MIARDKTPESPVDIAHDVVLVVKNIHMAECGSPPRLVTSPYRDTYVSCFQDGSGDQWLIQIDRRLDEGKLFGGDIGWDEPVDVIEDVAGGDLILAVEVTTWINCCWMAATGRWLW